MTKFHRIDVHKVFPTGTAMDSRKTGGVVNMNLAVKPWVAAPTLTIERVILATLVLLSGLGYVLFQPFVFPLDDAYITLGNARTLISGGRDSFGSTPLVGATSPVHLLMLAGLGFLTGFAEAGFILNAAALVLYGFGLARISVLGQNSLLTTICVVVIGLSAVDAPYHLFNGLETGLAMAATVWAIIWTLEGRRVALSILCGILPFIRPELLALSGFLGLYFCFQYRKDAATALRFFLISAIVAAPFLIWSLVETGSMIPLTSGAKKAFFAEAPFPLGLKMKLVLSTVVASGLAPLFVGLALLFRTRISLPLFLYLASFLAAFLVSFPLGLGHNYFRYLYVLVPVALVGWAFAAQGNQLARAGIVSLAIGYLLFSSLNSWHHVSGGRKFTEELRDTAEWVNANIPPDSKILVHDAGYISWATDFQLVDLVGLKTPSSIDSHQKWTLPSGGSARGKAINEIATDNDVAYAIILNDKFWGSIATWLEEEDWALEPLRQPQGRGYTVYRLRKIETHQVHDLG